MFLCHIKKKRPTATAIGFELNTVGSCPRADRQCASLNVSCVNGVCSGAECVCAPGYRGERCEHKALAFDFQTPAVNKRAGSYLKYRYVYQSGGETAASRAYDAHLRRRTSVQLMFRTRENTTDRVHTLFQMTSPNRAQYVYLEIGENRVRFRYDVGGGEASVALTRVAPVNDGRWHVVRAERYGAEAELSLDDGEAHKTNRTRGVPDGPRDMDVDRDSIFLGARVVQVKVSGYEVTRDYHDSCMMDVRFDGRALPLSAAEERAYEDVAIKMESVNVRDGCPSDDYCQGIFCPANQRCVDQWRLGECQCPHGQRPNGTRCEELSDDCQLCYPLGTRYCERYDEAGRLVAYENVNSVNRNNNNNNNNNNNQRYSDNSNDDDESSSSSASASSSSSQQRSSTTTVGDYPADSWYVSAADTSDEWRFGGSSGSSGITWPRRSSFSFDDDRYAAADEADGGAGASYRCVCRKGYLGQLCNAQASRRAAAFLSYEALSVILLCLLMLLVLVASFVAYARASAKHRHPSGAPKHYMLGVDPNDEVRETIINYVEEGCPDVDQSSYDITQLAKPLMGSGGGGGGGGASGMQPVRDDEFEPAVGMQRPPLQDAAFVIRRGN